MMSSPSTTNGGGGGGGSGGARVDAESSSASSSGLTLHHNNKYRHLKPSPSSSPLSANADSSTSSSSHSSSSSFNEDNFLRKLDAVTPTQDSIQSLALWIIHHKAHNDAICRLWMKKLSECKQRPKLIVLCLYICCFLFYHFLC